MDVVPSVDNHTLPLAHSWSQEVHKGWLRPWTMSLVQCFGKTQAYDGPTWDAESPMEDRTSLSTLICQGTTQQSTASTNIIQVLVGCCTAANAAIFPLIHRNSRRLLAKCTSPLFQDKETSRKTLNATVQRWIGVYRVPWQRHGDAHTPNKSSPFLKKHD